MQLTKQPSFNLGIVGHVDHGKTTLTKLLSGKWTDTHSEEIKRGITIKLGYTNFSIYKDDIEHIKMLELAGIKKIIVLQNKIDLVKKEEALENFKEIQTFLSTTPYKDSPVIPISAQYSANVSVLLEEILQYFDTPQYNIDEPA